MVLLKQNKNRDRERAEQEKRECVKDACEVEDDKTVAALSAKPDQQGSCCMM